METTTVQTAGASVPAVSVKVERGQRGAYGWELRASVPCQAGQAYTAAFSEAIAALVIADATMRRLFAGEPDAIRPT